MRAKKSLGQHFLNSATVVKTIVGAAELSREDTVLEIGPGKGILTKELVKKAGKVLAIEKDESLAKTLKSIFPEEIKKGTLTIISEDALTLDRGKLGLSEGKYKVVANIPYYITGKLLRILLEQSPRPSSMVLLLQKEVAERIVAKRKKPLDSARGKESVLSISVKAFGVPRYVKTVKASYFSPIPAVDSAVLAIERLSTARFKNISIEGFFTLVRAGFSQKRKFLRSNLSSVAKKSEVSAAFSRLSLSEKIRAEELSIDLWIALAEELS